MSGRFSRKLRVHPAKTTTFFLQPCVCKVQVEHLAGRKRRLDYPMARETGNGCFHREGEGRRGRRENSRAFIVSGSLALAEKEPFSLMGPNRPTFRLRSRLDE